MMVFRKSAARPTVYSDMTPMIDVVLQLVIFFLFTSSFRHVVRTEVDLPRERGDVVQAERPDELILDIARDGRIFLDARELGLEELLRIAAFEVDRSGGELELLVRADRSASAGRINEVASALASRGVRRWKLATSHAAGGGL